MAVFFDGRCACGRETCDFTCLTYTAYMCNTQNNIGTWQEHIKKKPITNADRIRSMTDEELATWLYIHRWNDLESILEWLKQESEGE